MTHTRPIPLLLGALTLLPGALVPAGSAAAVPLQMEIDEAQSQISDELGRSGPLSGNLTLELGELPPLVANTTFDVVDVAASGGGFDTGLDPDLENPGLGVLKPDGSFLIPALFITLDDGNAILDQTLVDVVGTFGPSAACGGELCLETSFDVLTDGRAGTISVDVVAFAPEPSMAVLSLASGVGLAVQHARRRRML